MNQSTVLSVDKWIEIKYDGAFVKHVMSSTGKRMRQAVTMLSEINQTQNDMHAFLF